MQETHPTASLYRFHYKNKRTLEGVSDVHVGGSIVKQGKNLAQLTTTELYQAHSRPCQTRRTRQNAREKNTAFSSFSFGSRYPGAGCLRIFMVLLQRSTKIENAPPPKVPVLQVNQSIPHTPTVHEITENTTSTYKGAHAALQCAKCDASVD